MISKLWTVPGACLLIVALASCGGGNSSSSGALNIKPDSIQLKSGASQGVPFELVGSQGVTNKTVTFRVSDPAISHVAPSSCVVSSGSSQTSSCAVTVTGKKKGTVTLYAEADGYERDLAPITVTDQNLYGTLSVTPQTATAPIYYTLGQKIPFNFTVQLTPTTGGKTIPVDTPLSVSMNQPDGNPFTFATQQCSLSTPSPSCSISGTLDATKVSPAGFTSTISVVGSWQAPPQAAFSSADDITINWLGSSVKQPGVITITSQSHSNQAYTGMKAPLFVTLDGNTLDKSAYQVTITTSDPSKIVFYQFPDGTNDLANIAQYTMNSVTCSLTLDNTTALAYKNSITSCGYGLYPKAGGSATFSVTVTETFTPSVSIPTFPNTVNFLIVDASTLSTGRTITFNNSSTDTVVVTANSGTASAYTSSVSVASGDNPTNPAKTKAGAQSQCGPTNLQNACPIGSTCVQGGQQVKALAGIPFYCYWDAPKFTSVSKVIPANNIPPNSSASLFIPSWSGITTGPQQVQWSGNYYVKKCVNGICPISPSTPGTGSTYAAETLPEVTYQHNASDFYDVSIINGVNYAIQFGPGGTTPEATNAYTCGTAGSMSAMGDLAKNPTGSGYLPASTWAFSPSTSNFPSPIPGTDSPSSYYAVVEPAVTFPVSTSCVQQSDCQKAGTSGSQCGWNSSKVIAGTYTFGSSDRVCGTFNSWATADQVWGWNMTSTNAAPFNLLTPLAVSPAFNSQTTVSVGDLQLCVNNTYSGYTNPQPKNMPDSSASMSNSLACGGTNWDQVTRPSNTVTTVNQNWISQVLPTISWLKTACPTCYTFPYDDMSATFTCGNSSGSNGSNTLNYTLTINNISNTFK